MSMKKILTGIFVCILFVAGTAQVTKAEKYYCNVRGFFGSLFYDPANPFDCSFLIRIDKENYNACQQIQRENKAKYNAGECKKVAVRTHNFGKIKCTVTYAQGSESNNEIRCNGADRAAMDKYYNKLRREYDSYAYQKKYVK